MPRIAYSLRQPREHDFGHAVALAQAQRVFIAQPTRPGEPYRVECRGQTVFTAPDVPALVSFLHERGDR